MEDKMDKKLENILTISATEYCEMVGNKLSEYKPVGVGKEITDENVVFLNVPEGTEVIVDFKIAYSISGAISKAYGVGTALVRKEKPKVEKI